MDELWQAFVQITASVNALLLGTVIIFSRRLHRFILGPAINVLIVLQFAYTVLTTRVFISQSRGLASWPRFKKLKRQYRGADWLEYLDGTPVGQMVSFPKWLVGLLGKRQLPSGLDWHYDSTPLLEH